MVNNSTNITKINNHLSPQRIEKKQRYMWLEINIIHLLTGYEGNSTFIVPKVPTIFRGNAEENSWYTGDN
jgi:hypothetical protein